jgi:hypothetical protein
MSNRLISTVRNEGMVVPNSTWRLMIVNIVRQTLINPIGKIYDRVNRNVYDDCRSGGTQKYPLEVFQTVKMVLYGSKRSHKTICSIFLYHSDVLIPWCP